MPDSDLEQPQTPEEEARDRRAANIFIVVFVVVLVGAGIWLGNALVAARKADDCLISGRRSCSAIEVPPR
jgi:hypothetical protein